MKVLLLNRVGNIMAKEAIIARNVSNIIQSKGFLIFVQMFSSCLVSICCMLERDIR